MKVVILAGGAGTRLAEETVTKPKPMVEIGGLPILWHIMRGYSFHGFNEFIVALGYRGEVVKRYFTTYVSLAGSFSLSLADGTRTPLGESSDLKEDWVVDLIDTGLSTNTGGRLKRLASQLTEPFLLTYGDGVSNIDIRALVEFHKRSGRIVTLSAVRPPARFGHIEVDGDSVVEFSEKPQIGDGWINGGFMVCQPEFLDYITDDDTDIAHAPLVNLAAEGKLGAYRHEGFWQCMDTIRDRQLLNSMWEREKAPWRTWA